MKSTFWTNENLSLIVAWSSSFSISCFKLKNFLLNFFTFFQPFEVICERLVSQQLDLLIFAQCLSNIYTRVNSFRERHVEQVVDNIVRASNTKSSTLRQGALVVQTSKNKVPREKKSRLKSLLSHY